MLMGLVKLDNTGISPCELFRLHYLATGGCLHKGYIFRNGDHNALNKLPIILANLKIKRNLTEA